MTLRTGYLCAVAGVDPSRRATRHGSHGREADIDCECQSEPSRSVHDGSRAYIYVLTSHVRRDI